MKQATRRQFSERGQTIIMIVLALIGLLSITGLVIDGGAVFLDRRKAQNAADSAALASALARVRGDQNFVRVALNATATNGYNNDGVTNAVTVQAPPASGSHKGDIEYIQIVIVSHVKTNFLGILGRNEITNTTEAVARSKMPQLKQLINGAALVSLAPESNCSSNKAFWVHGSAAFDISGGGVFVNSNNKSCALIQNGSSGIRVGNGNSINIVGGATIDKPQQLSPGVAVGASPVLYPPFFMPKVRCEKAAEIKADGVTMTPGSWEEEFPPKDVTELDPGVYCLRNGVKINNSLSGSGILLFVQEGGVEIGASANVNISAPTTGENAGLLIFLPMENKDKVNISGGTFMGTILAPASSITLNGGTNFHSQIIGYAIEATGNGNITVTYKAAENFRALSMPEVQLSQ